MIEEIQKRLSSGGRRAPPRATLTYLGDDSKRWKRKTANGASNFIRSAAGHHASSQESKGFCFFNNIAVAARHAQATHNVKRVLIVDWDVHFGDGTAEIFAEDDSVLYVSLHRFAEGFYPHTQKAAASFVGSGEGVGYTVNVAWSEEGHNDDDYLLAFSRVIMPIAYEFNPELVLVSSGFDACGGEHVQLGDCRLSPYGFSRMMHLLGSLANGKVIAALEGGYNIDNLMACSEAVLATMVTGAVMDAPVELPYKAKSFSSKTIQAIQDTINAHASYWNCLKPFAVVTDETA
uniref:histone deacetylase n=1 Tax=Steinernema glaseri TaxID=37863 RepID=A0A1I8ANZ7_9BILA